MHFPNPDPTPVQMLRHLRRANDVARRALELGRHPFGATRVWGLLAEVETAALHQGFWSAHH